MYFSFQTFNPVMYLVMISFQTFNLVLIITIWKIRQPDLSLTHQHYFCQTESLKKNFSNEERVHESTGQSCYMPSHRFQWNFASLKGLPQKDKLVSVLVFTGGR